MTTAAHLVVDLGPEVLVQAELCRLAYGERDAPELGAVSARISECDPASASAEDTLLQTERQMRRIFLRRGHAVEIEQTRSVALHRDDPRDDEVPVEGYERTLGSRPLERREQAAVRPTLPVNWSHDAVFVSSGMAAIALTLQTLDHLLEDEPNHGAQRWGAWLGDYFETNLLTRFRGLSSRRWRNPATVEDLTLHDDIGVVVVEPLRYGWDLATVAADALATALMTMAGTGRAPAAVIVDITLTPTTWPRREFLTRLSSMDNPPVVIEVRSGLKLDQQGLELAGVGVVSVLSCGAPSHVLAGQVTSLARLMRGTLGWSLGRAAQRTLELPFLFDPRWNRIHSGQVFQHNRQLAERLARESTGSYFSHVVHPSLVGGGESPFVILRMHGDDPDRVRTARGELLRRLDEDVRCGRTTLGNSFGFRGPRFEMIKPSGVEPRAFLKIAMGSRTGPAAARLSELLLELAARPRVGER